MWAHYRRTLLVTQIFILIACAVIFFFARPTILELLVIFLFMQLCSIVGAAWGQRLKRRVNSRSNALPLQGKL